jgi:hypothetical protein
MFGQFFPGDPVFGAPDGGAPDFWDGAGAVGVVDCVVEAALLVLVGDAAAPAMPATAPVVASAPATIVAPSILDTFIVRTSWGRLTACAAMVGPWAKRTRSRV